MSDPTPWRDDPRWPDVDVVMPIRNEAPHLEAALDSVRRQDYPGSMRIILGVGPSNDGTEKLAAQLSETMADLVVIDNPSGRTPSALNAAIRAGSAPVVVRVDGHSNLSPGYIRRAVETMRRTGAANVGGMQVPEPTTPFEESVATATTSWLGTGGASYRTGGAESAVDTVYLGVFDRAAIDVVGLFDERLIRNQDYELNIRIRQSGREVIFDPQLSVGYTPRANWTALTRQYTEYGFWKATVLRLHPDSLRFRQLLAPLGVIAVVAASVVGVRRRSAWVLPGVYAAALASVGTGPSRVRTAAVLATIHGSWTWGLVRGLLTQLSDDRKSTEPLEATKR